MTDSNHSISTLFGIFLMLAVVFSPLVTADDPPASLSADILTDWTDDGTGNVTHAYRIVLSESVSFSELDFLNVSINHENASGDTVGAWIINWTGGNNTELHILLNTTINWKDEIDISVDYDGTIIGVRNIVVTIWNEPLSDHEITRTTNIGMIHQASNMTANESWDLNFIGQGWQQRIGDSLEANELGTGTLAIQESIDGGTVSILMWLSTIWLNESTVGVDLQSQVFEMYGNGTLEMHSNNDGIQMDVAAQVVNSHIVRNWAAGVVEERLRLEASGNLSLNSSGGGEWMEADGNLALLLVETHDVDGVRILSNNEFEATADMTIHSDDSHIELDVQELINRERWENGQFVSSLERLRGHGSFDFSDSEENSSIVVNGTVINLFQESVDGMKTGDQLHVDGTISGDLNGDFGTVRDIIQTGAQTNATGESFQVNVIHTETWLNLTSMGANPFDVEAVHNNTWNYEVPQEHWDNRTVRLKWDSQEGGEPSSGNEYPENSPMIQDMEVPEAESAIGDVDITRESGLAPAQMLVGDSLSLLDSDLMHLTVTATHTGTVNRDGHVIPVTHWSGNYDGDGTATGAIVSEGVLAGLIAQVSREVTIDLDEEGESVTMNETQSLERVLSPSIITAGENSAPSIVSVGFREGGLVNENGMSGHLEVEVSDPDWNVRGVTVDLSPIGLGTVTLNDIGLEGDTAIHDDVFTTEVVYTGILDGNVSMDVNVFDDFSSVDETHNILIINRMPRITSVSFSPNTLYRGENTTVTLTAADSSGVSSVAVDTTQWGGTLTSLTQNGASWSGQVQMPLSISSGDQVLPIWVQDGDGGEGTTTMLTNVQPGDTNAIGPFTLQEMPPIHLLNQGPSIDEVTFWENGESVSTLQLPESGTNSYILTARVTDGDSISIVQAKLGTLAPPGQGESWLLMKDDGEGPDLIAGDGIYSIDAEVRASVPSGTIPFEIRGIDIQLAQTPVSDRTFTVEITTAPEVGGGGSEKLFEGASAPWIILTVVGILILLVGIGLFTMIRKDRLSGFMGVNDDQLPPQQ
ncbi:MAG: choice-of-anchor X domain-containing protein [Candidatus Thermoplasmatota archaeon]|nr:choice-of-anchor X domain-containing protein [Candidatus Thermoplasmatota archaeon]